jgi:hypothetical protein
MNTTATPALHDTSDAGLLTAYAALTHRIHEAAKVDRGAKVVTAEQVTDATRVDDLRTQRDLVRDEILRRMTR